jgi:hypothetical protein
LSDFIPFVLIPFIAWGVWRFLKRKGDLTPLKKRTFAIGISAFFITEMARSFYRPFIYANNIDDGHVADTIGNSFGTVTAIFMILTMAGSGTKKDWKIVALIIIGLLVYESVSLGDYHAFDSNDIFATLVFGALSILIYSMILKKYGRI